MKTIGQAYENLQPRERLFISVGGLFALTAVIYLALVPFAEKHSELIEQQSKLQADLKWLHDQGCHRAAFGE